MVYSKEELELIEKTKLTNEKLEIYFETARNNWVEKINPLWLAIKDDITSSNTKSILDAQSNAGAYKSMLAIEKSKFMERISKQDAKLKMLKQEKFIFYATGVPIKTNTSEKMMLIEAHISEETRQLELLQNYVEFLITQSKNLDNFSYTLKNVIDLFNLLNIR